MIFRGASGKLYVMKTPSAESRRDFLKQLVWLASAAAITRSSSGLLGGELSAGQLPQITLGTLPASRLILGSNPFFGFSHRNPQGSDQAMRAWYTNEQITSV